MAVVFMPKDLDRGKRIVINNAIKDFVPDTKCNVNKLFDSWEGKKSEERLKEILGHNTAEKLLKKIDIKNEKMICSRILSLIGLLQFSQLNT